MTKEILAAPLGFVPFAWRTEPALAADGAGAADCRDRRTSRVRRPRVCRRCSRSAPSRTLAYGLRRAGIAAGRIAVFGAAPGIEYEPDRDQAGARAGGGFAASCWSGSLPAIPRSGGFRTNRPPAALRNSPAARLRSASIITKDRLSPLHLISAGHAPIDRIDLLAAPGMVTNFDALAHSYDHVVVDAGAVAGPEIDRIAEIAPHAVLVAETLGECRDGVGARAPAGLRDSAM